MQGMGLPCLITGPYSLRSSQMLGGVHVAQRLAAREPGGLCHVGLGKGLPSPLPCHPPVHLGPVAWPSPCPEALWPSQRLTPTCTKSTSTPSAQASLTRGARNSVFSKQGPSGGLRSASQQSQHGGPEEEAWGAGSVLCLSHGILRASPSPPHQQSKAQTLGLCWAGLCPWDGDPCQLEAGANSEGWGWRVGASSGQAAGGSGGESCCSDLPRPPREGAQSCPRHHGPSKEHSHTIHSISVAPSLLRPGFWSPGCPQEDGPRVSRVLRKKAG